VGLRSTLLFLEPQPPPVELGSRLFVYMPRCFSRPAYSNHISRSQRCGEHNLEPLDTMTIPCVLMAEARPTFYLVPATTALNDAVISGTFPTTPTEVQYYPTIATHTKHMSVGAEDREYRKLFLRRFLAFKEVAKKHWEHILEGV